MHCCMWPGTTAAPNAEPMTDSKSPAMQEAVAVITEFGVIAAAA
jgi:hypothetical protein